MKLSVEYFSGLPSLHVCQLSSQNAARFQRIFLLKFNKVILINKNYKIKFLIVDRKFSTNSSSLQLTLHVCKVSPPATATLFFFLPLLGLKAKTTFLGGVDPPNSGSLDWLSV